MYNIEFKDKRIILNQYLQQRYTLTIDISMSYGNYMWGELTGRTRLTGNIRNQYWNLQKKKFIHDAL